MKRGSKSPTRKAANRFYHSAKVSEYQFKRVLWSFVLDEPVAKAAERMALSANSIAAIQGKLRVFFTELGVLQDIYEGGDPRDGTKDGQELEEFEFRLISFHLQRMRGKRRAKGTSIDEIDYHWCESHWRFQYHVMTEGRSSEPIHRMMYSHLLAHVRLSGPIGQQPRSRRASRLLQQQQLNQRVLWLERNALAFRDETSRSELREIRELD